MLTFDEATHTYFWNGEKVPGVSEFLAKSGLKPAGGYYAPGAAERGTEAHELTELYDHGLLDLDGPAVLEASAVVSGHLSAWIKFRADTGFVPHQIELRVCSIDLWLAGTIDRVGEIDGKRVKIDLKTGAKADWHRYQLAAYNLLTGNRDPRYCVYTKADGTYKVQPWSDDTDHLAILRAVDRLRGQA
ncbi:MAG: PD-(D/E)XK nuclease family protein [Spirochaetales bacterium]